MTWSVLVTGGCGFIGSRFSRYLLKRTRNARVTNLDALTYAGNIANIADLRMDVGRRYHFVHGDIADSSLVGRILREDQVNLIVNFAAETHVDRSIKRTSDFLRTNVIGVQILLEAARAAGVKRFVQVSTDEVYGSLGQKGKFYERLPLGPNSPYAASKAAAEMFCRAAHKTFDQDVVVTRSSNNYGPYQFPEKLVPLTITNALAGKPLPVYGDGKNVRDWIHVEDNCVGIWTVARRGRAGEAYNIGGRNERTNLEIVHAILDHLGKSQSLIHFTEDRRGHDRRYALDTRKIRRELGWRPRIDFARGLIETIEWYRQNRNWWEEIKRGQYHKYYNAHYAIG
jgi:dTDP-glucose 4,6-dehydratase